MLVLIIFPIILTILLIRKKGFSLCPSSRLRMVRGSVGKVRLATVAHNTTNPFTIYKSTNHHNHHHQQTTTNTTRYQICIQDED